jgi:hypothetical protein
MPKWVAQGSCADPHTETGNYPVAFQSLDPLRLPARTCQSAAREERCESEDPPRDPSTQAGQSNNYLVIGDSEQAEELLRLADGSPHTL